MSTGIWRRMPSAVLLVEENQIFALDAADIMLGLGVQTVRSAGDIRAACGVLEGWRPTVAVVSVGLALGTSFDIAERLLHLSIPMTFAVGYHQHDLIPARFRSVPVLRKPYTEETIRTALMQ